MSRPTSRTTRPYNGESWWPPRAEGCRNCGGSRCELTTHAARGVDARYNAPTFGLQLCVRCLRDPGAAWRMRWRLEAPDQEDRAA